MTNVNDLPCIELNSVETGYSEFQRNAAITRDSTRTIPQPVVATVHIEGHPARALIDTGPLANFMPVKLAEQIRVKHPTIQLAVQGSRSKVNFGTKVCFQHQGAN